MSAEVARVHKLPEQVARAVVGAVLDAVVDELRKVALALGNPRCDLALAARTMALRMEIAAGRAREGTD